MLTLNQVTWRWPGAADDCLQNISLTLGQGEWLALTGDNGAGKSTLLRVMAGLLSAKSGSVNLLNKPMAQYKNRQRAKIIGVLFQEAENQLFHSKVSEEVAYGLRLQKLPAAEVAQRTAAALRLCRLESVADAHPLDLHTAQRRMVAVACLEAMAPEALFPPGAHGKRQTAASGLKKTGRLSDPFYQAVRIITAALPLWQPRFPR